GPGTVALRDPFLYGPGVAAKPIPPGPKGPDTLEVQGIVSFPGGFLAIVDNTIVRVGDKVKGYKVEDITERTVLLRGPDGAPRRLTVPDIAVPAAPAAAPPSGAPPPAQPPAAPPTGPRR
ncbi:MAG TPA: hypothetical protein VFN71_03830, partial [Methylomirabilota bacterium]|nr:hypothetical protein [Methylomirabilota bacterium]